LDLLSDIQPFRETNLLDADCETYLWPNFFTEVESQNFYNNILSKTEWQQDEIKMYGKLLKVPRLSAWYADPGKNYSYSKILLSPKPWFSELLEIKARIETETGLNFNSVLLNLYRHGEDSMGWHRDNEPELGNNPGIASVSFGAGRLFKLRPYVGKKPVKTLELASGSLLLMKGATQHHWEHSVPKTKQKISSRLNLTFRQIV